MTSVFAKYMIVYWLDGDQGIATASTYAKAEDIRMNLACSLGAVADVYEYGVPEDEPDAPPCYNFLYS